MLQTRQRLTAPDCCRGHEPPRHSRQRRGWDFVAGALSLGVWVLMPKCPMCMAAHVALWTGLGLSFTAAAYLRWSLLAVSAAALVYLVAKRAMRKSHRAAHSL